MPDLTYRFPPTFTDPLEERQYRKQRLAAAFRLFSRFGFEEGVAGHITARDPLLEDHFWVNPFAMSFAHVTASDLLLVNHDGEVVEGRHPVNVAAFAIHSQVHRARPDLVAFAHTHSVHGRALSALGQLIEPITQDACAFYQSNALFDDYTGVVLDVEEGRRIAASFGQNKALVLRNHGLLTGGASIDSAAWWFIAAERCAQVQLLAQAAGKPIRIDPQQAAITSQQVGSEIAGWISFQPLYDSIVRVQPDLLA